MKKFLIQTFGCQMNVYDSERIVSLLQNQGYELTEELSDADIVLVNTCYIREKASEKVFSLLGRIQKTKIKREKSGKPTVVGIIGCVAKAEGENIFKRAPYTSIVVSSQEYHKLPFMIEKSFKDLEEENKSRNMDVKLSGIEKFDNLPEVTTSKFDAFISVQEGCDKFCTYCVVPFTRGREVSRPSYDILKEAKRFNDQGVVEINLLGQNVTAYNGKNKEGDEKNLAYLIKEISNLPNIKRIRYTTSYPTEMGEELIELHRKDAEPKLMPFVYLPMQAGSDNVLKKMNRRYSQETYLNNIKKLKEINPDIQVSSDFIVGFVGETDEDFNETLKVVDEVNFPLSYSFKYSRRPNTAADKMPEDQHIEESVKAKRLDVLQEKLSQKQLEFNQSCKGKEMPVLFTEEAKTAKDSIFGKSEFMQTVLVKVAKEDVKKYLGKVIDVKITKAGMSVLNGEFVNE